MTTPFLRRILKPNRRNAMERKRVSKKPSSAPPTLFQMTAYLREYLGGLRPGRGASEAEKKRYQAAVYCLKEMETDFTKVEGMFERTAARTCPLDRPSISFGG